MDLTVKNISNADDETLKKFYFEINNLHPKLVELINKYNLKIVFANKMSDVINRKSAKDIKSYKEGYTIENIDKMTRGLCSDVAEGGAICIFYNTAKDIIGAILYHEIGHLVDCHVDFKNPFYSSKQCFIEAYKKDLKENWDKIKTDKRYRLIHYIQNSTPDNPETLAMIETFAHCFARSFDKIDDIDIVGEYFKNCLKVTKQLVNEYLNK